MAKRKAKKRGRTRGKRKRAAAAAARAVEVALAGIAHDIRTPLTGIVALAELLAASGLGAREREWANAIKSGADHLAALTTLIVDAAKPMPPASRCVTSRSRRAGLPRRSGIADRARAETRGIKADVVIANDLPVMVAGDALRLRTRA